MFPNTLSNTIKNLHLSTSNIESITLSSIGFGFADQPHSSSIPNSTNDSSKNTLCTVQESAQQIAQSVFLDESLEFDEYFVPFNSQQLNGIGCSAFIFKDIQYQNQAIFIFEAPIDFTSPNTNIQQENGYLIINTLPGQVHWLYIQNTAIFLFREGMTLWCGMSDIPEIPSTTLPIFLKNRYGSPQTPSEKLLALAYSDYYPNPPKKHSIDGFLAHLQSLHHIELCPLHVQILGHFLETKVQNLQQPLSNIKNAFLTEQSLIDWLIIRDEIHVLLTFSKDPNFQQRIQIQLQKLDTDFPHTQISEILPKSFQLSQAWNTNPSAWWGKSAYMKELYDQVQGTLK